MQTQSLKGWIQNLFSKNGIAQADGRPLYAYRIDDESFGHLYALLKKNSNVGVYEAEASSSYFAAGWLFYAAEWWKRNYQGGPWAWEPIFKALGYEDPDPSTRGKWVDNASSFWKLKDSLIEGKRFISKVVVNGGLPLNLIREADGSLSRLLHAVLNEAMLSSSSLTNAQILSQIDLHSSYLPKTYRQKTVYILLAQVVRTVIDLKEKLANTGENDPIAYLDQKYPDWLNDFPLRIDSDSARRLLSKLIRQAMAPTKRAKQPFSVIRQIRFDSDYSNWQYECLFDASSKYPVSLIAMMLNQSEDDLPVSLDLVVSSGSLSTTVGQMLRRDTDYLIKLRQTELRKNFFHQSLRLEVSRLGQILGSLDLQRSEEPDPLVPWVFENNNSSCKLLWAGSCQLKAETCLILSPDISCLITNTDNVDELVHANGKKIHRVNNGEIEISIENESFQIKCGEQESKLGEGIVWGSNRIYLDSSPSHIFLGTPRLERVEAEGTRRSVSSAELFWRSNNVDSGVDNIRNFGVGTLFWRRQGKTLLRLKAVCLPGAASSVNRSSIEYIKNKEQIQKGNPSGTIKLNGWPVSSLTCSTENVSLESKRIENAWELCFSSKVSPPPLTLALRLSWSGVVQSLSVPFPIEGAFIVGPSNEAIDTNALISVKQANHLNVHLRGMQNRDWQIRMRLENTLDTQRIPDLVVKFRPLGGVTNQVVRLYDLQQQIRQLLSLTSELDAQVTISFEYGGNKKNQITVARYSHNLNIDKGNGWVTLDDYSGKTADFQSLEQSKILTLPILDADQVVRNLKPVLTQNTHVGSWEFEPELKQPGTWLIFPSSESSINARPVAWIVPDRFAKPEPNYIGLKAAMNIQNRSERLSAISQVFKIIAEEPGHSDWHYVQLFVEKLGHLPLASLDMWIAISRVPRAVVCAFLTLDGFAEKIADRICDELPFEWLLTSPQDWLSVIINLRKNILQKGGNERDERFLKLDLESRLIWILERYSALEISVKLALVKGLQIENIEPETKLLISMPGLVVEGFLPKLLIDDDSDQANFIRRSIQHASYDIPAPSQLKSQTTKFVKSNLGKSLFGKVKLDISDWKYSLVIAPMMIAYSVANDESKLWIEQADQIFALRQYREFDRAWFDECYKVSMACAFNEGLISV